MRRLVVESLARTIRNFKYIRQSVSHPASPTSWKETAARVELLRLFVHVYVLFFGSFGTTKLDHFGAHCAWLSLLGRRTDYDTINSNGLECELEETTTR